MSDFGQALEAWITEAMLGDRVAENFLRQRFKIPPEKTIRQYFDEVAATEFKLGPPYSGEARS